MLDCPSAIVIEAIEPSLLFRRQTRRAHSKPARPSINEITPRPSVGETTPRPTVPDPYYRLSDLYYGDSDPCHGLFDFFVVPPYGPGNAYRYLRPVGR